MKSELVLAEWHRAQRALASAQLLSREGYYEDAIGRTYYAVFHAAKAALCVHDVTAKTHAGVRGMFGLHLIKPGEIEAEWSAPWEWSFQHHVPDWIPGCRTMPSYEPKGPLSKAVRLPALCYCLVRPALRRLLKKLFGVHSVVLIQFEHSVDQDLSKDKACLSAPKFEHIGLRDGLPADVLGLANHRELHGGNFRTEGRHQRLTPRLPVAARNGPSTRRHNSVRQTLRSWVSGVSRL